MTIALTCFFAGLSNVPGAGAPAAGGENSAGLEPREEALGEVHPFFGGVGGVYFLADPGELVVEVLKRDRNETGEETDLRAVLFGPDREVLGEAVIPDDGKEAGEGVGPVQRVRLSTEVERRGVYGLNVTVAHDRFGEKVDWTFQTNARRYLIETSRGWRGRVQEEPIVLRSESRAADIWFRPREDRAFEVEVTDLPEAASQVRVYDGEGSLVEAIDAVEGKAVTTISGQGNRNAVPWRLHMETARARVHVGGVTRWEEGDAYPNLCYWTFEEEAWFPFLPNRWLLTPYGWSEYGKPGEAQKQVFSVHNNAPEPRTVALELEFPEERWPVRLSTNQVTLESQESREVVLAYEVPEEAPARVHLRGTPVDDTGFSTFATLKVTPGAAPAREPLPLPLELKPYRHENEQFGYSPDFPTDWELYFDRDNRPATRTGEGVKTLEAGEWRLTPISETARTRFDSFESVDRSLSKISYDANGGVYLLAGSEDHSLLLYSGKPGRPFEAYDLGRDGLLDIEQFSGHNTAEAPPIVVRSYGSRASEGWGAVRTLELIPVRKHEDGGLHIDEPVVLSERALGVGQHAGVPSAVVSRGSRVHVIWQEATATDEDVPGAPAYVVTYDREKGALLGEPVRVAHGPPANNVHNRPSITIDSKGYLHAIAGTHNNQFRYARTLEPNTAHQGWTDEERIPGSAQSYIGLVCDSDDTLHLVSRRYRRHWDHDHTHAMLVYQRKESGDSWTEPRPLIIPPFAAYGIYYHRLTIDRKSRLFLSYSYFPSYWFYRNDYIGGRRDRGESPVGIFRRTMMSEDGGETWRFVMSCDLEA